MKKNILNLKLLFLSALMLYLTMGFSQNQSSDAEQIKKLEDRLEYLTHRFDRIEKMNEDLLWYQKVGDVAFIDKVYITGPPNPHIKNPTAMGVDNPVKFWNYVFIPKNIDPSKKYPLLIFPHGGVHGDFTTYYQHIISPAHWLSHSCMRSPAFTLICI